MALGYASQTKSAKHSEILFKSLKFGRSSYMRVFSFTSFSSGQVIELELDTNEHRLKISIDRRLVLIASNIEDKGTYPFVCLAYEESATLESRYKKLPQLNSVAADNRKLGFNNLIWTKETDATLADLPITGLNIIARK